MRKKWIAQAARSLRFSAADQAKLTELLKPVGPEVTKSNPALNAFYNRVKSVADKN